MSWIQKLCEVYDAIIGTPDCDMLSVGFINKNIELNIILSAKGEFVTAELRRAEHHRRRSAHGKLNKAISARRTA